jgi:hypothetical protein
MYRDDANAKREVLLTVRPAWRARNIRWVMLAACGVLLSLLLVRQPTTTFHLSRTRDFGWDDGHSAAGELCERRIWMDCGPVALGDGSVNPRTSVVFGRHDVLAWLAASSPETLDYSGGGLPYASSALATLALAVAILVALRMRVVRLVRVGPELRIEDRRTDAVLVGEVRSVDLQSASATRHGIVFVLEDGRRVPVGAPSFPMNEALAVRRNVREALEMDVRST